MSGKDGDEPGMPAPTVVEEADKLAHGKRYVEFKCGFKDRQGNPACDWTTNLMARTMANQLLEEHWTISHEAEFRQIQQELKINREETEKRELKRIRDQEMEEEIARERNIFAVRAEHAEKLRKSKQVL